MTRAYDDHPEFNDSLDADGDVKIAGVLFRPSEILFKLDPDAYDSAHWEWEEERRQELRDMLGTMRLFRQNARRLEELAEASRRGAVVPFVGAGLTVPCGMPAWSPFLVKAAIHAGIDGDSVRARLKSGEYEEVAQEVITALGEPGFNELIEGSFTLRGRAQGPIAYLPRFATGCVITTNFDDVVEHVYRDAGASFSEHVIGCSQTGFGRALADRQHHLLKLHGNARDPRTRVLTMAEYTGAYGDGNIDYTRELPKTLRKAFMAARMLFLGCSLYSDRTLGLFKEVIDQEGGNDIPRHFAVLELHDESDVAARERFLNDRHIFPIWFSAGEYSCIDAVLALLAGDIQ